jgi:hypothetical protein
MTNRSDDRRVGSCPKLAPDGNRIAPRDELCRIERVVQHGDPFGSYALLNQMILDGMGNGN